MQSLYFQLYADGVLQAQTTTPNSSYTDDLDFETLWLGPLFPPDPAYTFRFRNVMVGTTQGDDDIWAPTISGSVVPPFDSIVGNPAYFSESGGIVTVTHPGFPVDPTDTYALETLAGSYKEIWVRFDLDPDAPAAGWYTPDFVTVGDTAWGRLFGVYIEEDDGEYFWGIDASGGATFPQQPVPGDWMTVDLHLTFTPFVPPAVPGQVFDGGAAFRAA